MGKGTPGRGAHGGGCGIEKPRVDRLLSILETVQRHMDQLEACMDNQKMCKGL